MCLTIARGTGIQVIWNIERGEAGVSLNSRKKKEETTVKAGIPRSKQRDGVTCSITGQREVLVYFCQKMKGVSE